MAYMRGDNYLWLGEDGLHIWCRKGYDGWDVAEWHAPDDDGDAPVVIGECDASGVCIAQDIIDEYVIMRLCELIEDKQFGTTVSRALDKWERPSLQNTGPRLKDWADFTS